MNNGASGKTRRLALTGLLSAIIIVQSFTPLGYIPIGPLSPTAIHVTVALGAVLMGPMVGAQLGLVWGMVVWIRAFVYPTSALAPIIFTNPVTAILPRVMIGVVAGWLYLGLRRARLSLVPSAALAGIAGAITNTLLVMGGVYLFTWERYAGAVGLDPAMGYLMLVASVGMNGVAEMLVAGIIVPALAKPLLSLRRFGIGPAVPNS